MQTPRPPVSPTPLRRNRDFNVFWAGQALSSLGDAFALIGMPLLVLEATGSVMQMGLITGTHALGQVVVAVFAGVIADRFDRRRLMLWLDLGRSAVYLAVPLGWWLFGPQVWLLYVSTLAGAALGMCFHAAYLAAIPNLVEREQVAEANGRLEATYALAYVVGPMLAGLVVAAHGAVSAIAVDAFSYVLSAVSLIFVRLRPRLTAVPGPSAQPAVAPAELLAGIRWLLGQPALRAVALLMMTLGFLVAGGYDLFIFYLKHDLAQGDDAVGLVFGVASLGGILAGLLAGPLQRRFGGHVCFLASLALQAAAIGGVGLARALAPVTLLVVVAAFAETIKTVVSQSLYQQTVPDHLLGRVAAAFWVTISWSGPLGAALTTAAAAWLGAPVLLVLVGCAGMALAAVARFTPAARPWPGRAAPPEPAAGG